MPLKPAASSSQRQPVPVLVLSESAKGQNDSTQESDHRPVDDSQQQRLSQQGTGPDAQRCASEETSSESVEAASFASEQEQSDIRFPSFLPASV